MAPTAGEILFVDTNVLLTATDASRPQHGDATGLLNRAAESGFHLAVSGQVLREYLVVATRPLHANGLGLSTRDAVNNVKEFLRCVHLCDETEATTRRLRDFALNYDLQGKRLHDANIVATMATHGIRTLVTQNAEDFACRHRSSRRGRCVNRRMDNTIVVDTRPPATTTSRPELGSPSGPSRPCRTGTRARPETRPGAELVPPCCARCRGLRWASSR